MSDDFYLEEEVAEWLSQKKSELLAWVIQNREEGDIPFEEFPDYLDKVPETISSADESWEQIWDNYSVHIQLKMFETDSIVWLFVVSLRVPVLNEESGNEVMVPILILPTRHTSWLKEWRTGEIRKKRQTH